MCPVGNRFISLLFLLLVGCDSTPRSASPSLTLPVNFSPEQQALRDWPVTGPLDAPIGLRPCCAFGYNLKVQLLGIPIPFYRLYNVIDTHQLGEHHYNTHTLGAASKLLGFTQEKSGILYTRHGGFIDIAHIRDTADHTFYLFSHILPRLGEAWQLDMGEELAQRRIQFTAFTAPEDPAQRYTLAAYLAGHLAFQLAVWHEIVQWYGYQSIPGISEEVSAFSPEDLYSNLLGARLAINNILAGHASSITQFNLSMENTLPAALQQLGAATHEETRFQLDRLDGNWWDSRKSLPEKFLVRYRNYHTTSDAQRLSTLSGGGTTPHVSLPTHYGTLPYAKLGELQLWPGQRPANLPPPLNYYTPADFPALALHAHMEDAKQLRQK